MKRTIVTITIFLLLLTACDNTIDNTVDNTDNAVNTSSNPTPLPPITIDYSAGGIDVSEFLGWQWAKDGGDFIWLFKNDGTVSVIHCCGDVYNKQFSYLLRGNVLITYGSEVSFAELEATAFTMADDGLSFTRDNGTVFTRGDPDTGASFGSPLNLSNDLLGTWRGEDGTEYAFSADAGLRINSEEYGYFVYYAELLTLGPLIDETPAVLQEYRFNRKGNTLYLRHSDGRKYTLNFVE